VRCVIYNICMYDPPLLPRRIYRGKTKTRLRCLVDALFHHVISFIPEALRHWTSKNIYYYWTIKYLYCLLKPYFHGPNGFKRVVRKFLVWKERRDWRTYCKYQMLILFVTGIQKCHPAHLTLRAISQGRKLLNVLNIPMYALYNASLFSERWYN